MQDTIGGQVGSFSSAPRLSLNLSHTFLCLGTIALLFPDSVGIVYNVLGFLENVSVRILLSLLLLSNSGPFE